MNLSTIERSALVCVLTVVALFAADYPTLYCQANNVNVKAQSNADSEVLGILSVNDSIVPVAENDDWYKIDYQGQEAWVDKTFFSLQKQQTAGYWYNSKSGVNSHLHFTPTSSSWLNMVECWFSELTSKRIRRGSFKNVKDLIKAIKQYIASHNQNPKIFVWTASVKSIMRKISKCKDLLETAH